MWVVRLRRTAVRRYPGRSCLTPHQSSHVVRVLSPVGRHGAADWNSRAVVHSRHGAAPFICHFVRSRANGCVSIVHGEYLLYGVAMFYSYQV